LFGENFNSHTGAMTQFLSEATAILASTGEPQEVLQRLTRAVVPSLADFCFIHLADKNVLRCAASAHATPKGRRLVRGLARAYRILRDDPLSSVAQVVRTGRPHLRSEIAAEHQPASRARVFDIHRQLAPKSAIVVPLMVGERAIGALTLCYAGSGRRYTAQNVPGAKRLARQIAAYVANAKGALATRGKPLRGAASTSRRSPPLRARV
jgi:GAF domain-containing protein